MNANATERLQYLCDTIPALLRQLDHESLTVKPKPDKWSKKEIIGHLIDSATNNHHRFVRGQFENIPSISYNQDLWNQHNYYQNIDNQILIELWTSYNKLLLYLIKQIPESKLTNKVNTGNSENHTLAFLIDDYVVHLEHHLHQIVSY